MESFDLFPFFEVQAEKRYDPDAMQDVRRRIFFELRSLKKTGQLWKFFRMKDFMDSMGLTSKDIIFYGTGGGSLLLYLMGVTYIDPMKYNLRQEFTFGLDGKKKLEFYFGIAQKNVVNAVDFFNLERFEEYMQSDNKKKAIYYCEEAFSFREDSILTELSMLPVEEDAKQNTYYTERELKDSAKRYALGQNTLERKGFNERRYHRDLSELEESEELYSRDHLYQILKNHEISRGLAWEITEYIRRGGAWFDPAHKMKKYRAVLKEHGLSHDFRVVCQRVRYLSPMAMCLQMSS